MFTREAAKPDPHFDYGVVIQMTPGGFHPAWLVSPCCMPIIWVNLTSTPDSLLFDALKVRSGEIPPGKSFVYTPLNVESIAYHSLTDTSMSGVVQVNSTSEPGP